MLLAVILAVVVLILAALHAYWGFGGVWPGSDPASCARKVAGFRGITGMPGPGASFAVAGALALVAFFALSQGGAVAQPFPRALLTLGTLGAAMVFLGRGFAGFTPAWRRRTPEQPFATLDVRYYSPLCLAIGAGLVVLLFNGTSA